MAIQFDCDVNNTQMLLGNILIQLNAGQRAKFFCDPGMGDIIMQRVRVMLSRVRKRRKIQGQKRQHFNLHYSTHVETHESKRRECVVVWKSQNLHQRMTERLEDLVGHGDTL